MSTIARAWDALMRALAEASGLHRGGADANSIAALLQHARELLDIIEQEMADQAVTLSGDARASTRAATRPARILRAGRQARKALTLPRAVRSYASAGSFFGRPSERYKVATADISYICGSRLPSGNW